MSSSGLCLGAILVILIIIVAYFAWRQKSRRGVAAFTYATPATPRVREAVAGLFASLKHMVALGRSFENQAAHLDDATAIVGARQSAAHIVGALDRTEKSLSGAPPTYANYLAVYRGLTSTDVALLNAADAYRYAGHEAQQLVALTPAGAPVGAYAAMANTLLAMGNQLRQVVAAVHRLGVALDVE